jgi:hypothetical protein
MYKLTTVRALQQRWRDFQAGGAAAARPNFCMVAMSLALSGGPPD